MKALSFTDTEGRYCVSNGAVPISYCSGTCDSYDSSIFYSYDDDVSYVTAMILPSSIAMTMM